MGKCIGRTQSFSISEHKKLLYLSMLSKWLSTCRTCRQLLYSLYWYKYKQRHSNLTCFVNVTSIFGDILLFFWNSEKQKRFHWKLSKSDFTRFWYEADDLVYRKHVTNTFFKRKSFVWGSFFFLHFLVYVQVAKFDTPAITFYCTRT